MKKHYFFIIFLSLFYSCSSSEEKNDIVIEEISPRAGRVLLLDSKNIFVWSDWPTEKIYKNHSIPNEKGEYLELFMAKNETEPIQIAINPQKDIDIQISTQNLPEGLSLDLYRVDYIFVETQSDNLGKTGYVPDPLFPISENQKISIKKGENSPFWLSFYSSPDIRSGDYIFYILVNNEKIEIKLHIFDFKIDEVSNVKSQMNLSFQNILDKYGVEGTGDDYWLYVDNIKRFFQKHRLTPKNPLWPGGLTSNGGSPFIDYNCETGDFSDPHDIWGFENQAEKTLPMFPSFMMMTFQNNDPSNDQRPNQICGVSKSSTDWLSTDISSEFNQKWFKYISDLERYLDNKGYLDKSYHYFANEPQNQDDYDAIIWYSKKLKEFAPNIKLMVSEEPKPEIYNYSGKIDIWLPVLNNFNPEISGEREIQHGEESWIYFLHGTTPPYFNPITLDHPAIEGKLLGWFLWRYRVRGVAYYSLNNWSENPWTTPMNSGQNGNLFLLYPPSKDNKKISYGKTEHKFVTSIRLELIRDGLEDYEYLYNLNSKKNGVYNQQNIADKEAEKIIKGLISYNRNSNYNYTLRKYIGLKIEGSIDVIPDIIDDSLHERAKGEPQNYYINFQNPEAEPFNNPLVVNEKTYIKIGWNQYSSELGYGWFGDLSHVMYQYLSNASDVLSGSIIYDDWGRTKTFEFDLPNGDYLVTVSCGWEGKKYSHNKITVEDISFIDDEESNSYIKRSKNITIKDNKLTMEMGIFDEYTMLNYLEIEAIK
ncbi:DUF4091 domain-containing protein [bacterium]|nr:DUF4091 domain-containing protein [bacterium]